MSQKNSGVKRIGTVRIEVLIKNVLNRSKRGMWMEWK